LGIMGWIATTVIAKGLNVLLHAKLLDNGRLNS
jgi:hypothetical protein